MCVILYNYGQLDYFDSLGRPAEYYGGDLHNFVERIGQKHKFMQRRIQSFQSDVCGLYVVYFAVMRLCLHFSVRDIYKGVHTNDLEQNDRFICLYFQKCNE